MRHGARSASSKESCGRRHTRSRNGRCRGPAAACEPRTRRPARSPNRTIEEVKTKAVGVPAPPEQSQLDCGPISVYEKMRSLAIKPVPSTAARSWIVRDAEVARVEPWKKPRSRFGGSFIRGDHVSAPRWHRVCPDRGADLRVHRRSTTTPGWRSPPTSLGVKPLRTRSRW